MKKKMVSVLLALTMCMGFTAVACATDNAPEEPEVPVQTVETEAPDDEMISHEGIIEDVGIIREDNARDAKVPSEHWNLSGTGDYTASFHDLAATMSVNTLYYFTTSTGCIDIVGTVMRSGTTTDTSRKLVIEIYERKKDKSSWDYKDSVTVNFSAAEQNISRTFYDLNTNYFYYIKFKNDSASNTGSSKDISAILTISKAWDDGKK